MSIVDLFFGYPVSARYLEILSTIDPRLKKHFIQEKNDTYLMEVRCRDQIYLGKKCGRVSDLAALEMLQANVYSLLKKLTPNYPVEQTPLTLFPLIHIDYDC